MLGATSNVATNMVMVRFGFSTELTVNKSTTPAVTISLVKNWFNGSYSV
ncbi:hypothetical protein Hanom_Chr16g01417101 [Helianthus anomalus]